VLLAPFLLTEVRHEKDPNEGRGSGPNGNMFFSFFPPRDCSFSEFGGDPDYGFNKWSWAP
jgi:hypothetical protein